MATPTFLATSQFVGDIEIDFGNKSDFNNIAYQFEQDTLKEMLGSNLKYVFLNSMPEELSDVYNDLKDGLSENFTAADGYEYEMHGITAALKYLFFGYYMKHYHNELARTDNVEQAYIESVNGTRNAFNMRIVKMHNKGVNYYTEVQRYIEYLIDKNNIEYLSIDYFEPETKEHINIYGI